LCCFMSSLPNRRPQHWHCVVQTQYKCIPPCC
jgi:hypothetical protein